MKGVLAQETQDGWPSGQAKSGRVAMDPVSFGTVLVGPNVLLREGLTRILSAADFRILASACCVDDIVLPAPSQAQSILLIIDVSDDFDAAVAQIEFFKEQYPFARVAVLAHHHQLAEMISAFRAGANAYFVKVAADTFIKSLELVMLGETIVPSAILALMLDQRRDGDGNGGNGHDDGHYDARRRDYGEDECHDEAEVGKKEIDAQASLATEIRYAPRLSDRQRTILGCLLEGDSNKTIARKMAIAEATVKVHVKAILRKIRVHNRTQAAIWAMNNSLFSPAKHEGSSAAEDLVVRSSPARHAAQVLSAGRRNGSALLPAFKIEGPSHGGALPSIDGFIRKGIIRKNE
jgi:two-component system nitrate/nitrite response regulator NarL